MKFGLVPTNDALGAILAHGVPAASLNKGITLGPGHIESLLAIGITSIMAAQIEDGDVDEDAAATQLANALAPDPVAQGVRLTLAKTGRVNIYAQRAGLMELDIARITALNAADPMITLATLPELARVTAGVMLATIKIIPYAVPHDNLARACAAVAAGEGAPLNIRHAHITTATLIETVHAGQRPQPKGRRVLDERMDRLGATLTQILDVPHEESAIADAIERAEGGIVFILTASATSDVNDTAPTAIRRAGGTVIRYGMPVDPGNLLVLAQDKTGRPVIGLPGCARSPALNGADWVLERVMCGLPVDADDISAMGVGGLLKDIPERGRSRIDV